MLLLTRRRGQAITIQPGQGTDLASPVGRLFSTGPIVVQVNRFIQDQVKLGITAHPDLLILREEIAAQVNPGYPADSNRLADIGSNDCRIVLAGQIRYLCQQRQLTPAQLAKVSGVALTTLAAIEHGKGVITLDELQQLARALGMRVGMLLGG